MKVWAAVGQISRWRKAKRDTAMSVERTLMGVGSDAEPKLKRTITET